MTAIGVVRFKPKPGMEEEFEKLFRSVTREFEGLRKASLVKAADGRYFSVGEWESFDEIVAARPDMAKNLDKFRHTLSDLGPNLGVTDAISGEVIFRKRYDGRV